MDDAAPHIVIVDDHRDIREPLARYLEKNGFRATAVESGAALRRALQTGAADLIVLDIMMPGEDGLEVCRALRVPGGPAADTPVIFLTAMAEDADRIVGLELGADDYVVKPFNPRELLARIKAVLRRSVGPKARREAPSEARLRFDRWRFDLARRELVDEAGVAAPLSAADFRLLKTFVERPGVVLSRDQLMDLTSGRAGHAFDRSVDNQVSRLRRKIERDPKAPELIKTVWGGGYVFAAPVTSEEGEA
ncbi:MAG: response regulator [Pseudomonadota bacterium]